MTFHLLEGLIALSNTNQGESMKDIGEIIQSEIAAVKSIDTVLHRVENDIEKSELTSIRQDHVRAVDRLKRFSTIDTSDVGHTGGPWSGFASAFTGGASLFGDKAALQALKVCEEYGIKKYRAALQEDAVDIAIKDIIRSELLPQQERHLSVINKYLH